MARYLIEVIYEEIGDSTGADGQFELKSTLKSQVWSFENEDATVALTDARNELQRVVNEGLKLHGGAVIETTILPSAIKQIGLIDFDRYEADNSAVKSVASPVTPEMPVATETTPVDFNITSQL